MIAATVSKEADQSGVGFSDEPVGHFGDDRAQKINDTRNLQKVSSSRLSIGAVGFTERKEGRCLIESKRVSSKASLFPWTLLSGDGLVFLQD